MFKHLWRRFDLCTSLLLHDHTFALSVASLSLLVITCHREESYCEGCVMCGFKKKLVNEDIGLLDLYLIA